MKFTTLLEGLEQPGVKFRLDGNQITVIQE
jgi:hypothetical protein